MRSSEFATSRFFCGASTLHISICFKSSTQGKKPLTDNSSKSPAVPRKKSATVRFMDAVQRGIRTVTRPSLSVSSPPSRPTTCRTAYIPPTHLNPLKTLETLLFPLPYHLSVYDIFKTISSRSVSIAKGVNRCIISFLEGCRRVGVRGLRCTKPGFTQILGLGQIWPYQS